MLLYVMIFGLFLKGDPVPYVEYTYPQLMTETDCKDIAERLADQMIKSLRGRPYRNVEIKYGCLKAGVAI